jgi:hypothetical protein
MFVHDGFNKLSRCIPEFYAFALNCNFQKNIKRKWDLLASHGVYKKLHENPKENGLR